MNIGNLIRRDADASKQKPGMAKAKASSGDVWKRTDVLRSGSSPEAGLRMLRQRETGMLTVCDGEQCNGFVFKSGRIACVARQKQRLEGKGLDYVEELGDLREQ